MARTWFLPMGSCVMAAVVACASVAWGVQPPAMTVPDSFGVQLKADCAGPADLDRVKELGLKVVRRGFIWESMEKEAGVYDFSAYDRLVKDCRDRGLTVIGCMAFSNKLYGHVKDEKGREAYAKFAAALAEHFKGENILWEIWNEPNVQTFWGKHGKHNSEQYADEYVALVKATVPAMKKADPNCYVMAGAVSGLWSASYEWQEFCFQKGVLGTAIDAWSVHPYSTKCPEDYVEAYAKLRGMMAKVGAEKLPILNSERGYPLQKAEGFAGGDPAKSKEYQAWHLVRQYLIDQACGIKVTSWYEWSGKEGFGLVEGEEKSPAYSACKALIAQLRGYTFDKRLDTASPRDFVLRYVSKGGGVKLVAWTSPPSGASPDEAKPHEVSVPVEGASGELATAGLYGEPGKALVKDGSVKLMLTGAPQYLAVRGEK